MKNAGTGAEHFERDVSAVVTMKLNRERAVDDYLKRICAALGVQCGTRSQRPPDHVRALQHVQAQFVHRR